MLLSLIVALGGTTELPAIGGADPSQEPVRLWMNGNRSYRPGDRVQVQVETGAAGYLLVLHMSPDTRLKVLFPIEPGDEMFVRGGRRYEVREPELAQSFFADGTGPGLVLAALAQEPWRLESAVVGGAWNYGFLSIPGDSREPEADIVALLQRLSPPGGFDYDVMDYAVVGRGGRYATDLRPPRWWSPTYVNVYLDFYDPHPRWYDWWWSCWSCYPSSWWDGYPPWWYAPWGWPYRPYRYTIVYYPWPYYPWPGGIALPRPPGRVPAIVGRPRGYVVGEFRPWTERARATDGRLIAGGFRRPSIDERSDAPSAVAAVPARRARARGDEPRATSGGTAVADHGAGSTGRPEPVARPSTGSGGTSPPAARPSGTSGGGSQPSVPARSRPRAGRGGGEASGDGTAGGRVAVPSGTVVSPPARSRSQSLIHTSGDLRRSVNEVIRTVERRDRPRGGGEENMARPVVPATGWVVSPPPPRSVPETALRAKTSASNGGSSEPTSTRSRSRPRGN
jgi:hypothetical protein